MNGNDVVMEIGSGSIFLEDAAGETIRWIDENGELNTTVLTGVTDGTAQADVLNNGYKGRVVNGLAGNDTINNGYFDSDDNYQVGVYNVTLNGGAGNDVINNGYVDSAGNYYAGGDVTINGGAGNDTINNYSGDFVIQYASGDGNDVINDLYLYNSFYSVQITSGSVSSAVKSGDDVILNIGNGSITFIDGVGKEIGWTNDDGQWQSTIFSGTITGTAGNDTIENHYKMYQEINALAGDDYIYNYGQHATIDAGAGDDTIQNNAYGSSINGGAGNDTIYNSMAA